MKHRVAQTEATPRSHPGRGPRLGSRRWPLYGFILLLALAGAVGGLGASTPRQADDVVTPARSAGPPTSAQRETSPALDAPLSLAAGLDVRPWTFGGETVYILTLGVMTTSTDGEVVTFPTGQMYDFAVTQGGREVWRWSRGRAFHQAFVQRTLDYGRLHVFVAVWDGRAQDGAPVAGDVEVHGILTAAPPVAAAPVPVHLE